jgi:hypothetical protein
MIYNYDRRVAARSPYHPGDVVTYKGRQYRVEYAGKTRYGDKAKLQFMDGSKSFWVDLDRVTSTGGRGSGGYGGYGYNPKRMVWFQYWNGKRVRMTEEEADAEEDNGRGTHV